MDTVEIAHEIYAYLKEHDYPYLAPTLHVDGLFSYVELWNDRYQAEQVIVCYALPEEFEAAREYALRMMERMMSEGAPCGVVACVATDDLQIVEVE